MIRRLFWNGWILGWLVIFGLQTAHAAEIQWMKYEEGLARANSNHKKIFLNFHAEWCVYCTKMNKETFTNPALIAYMNENFVPIKVDSDKEPAIAQRYRVQGLPTSWFLTDKGEQIANQPGFIPAEHLLNMMKYVSTDSYKTLSFKEFLKKK
ncbi:MAG: DUF255 domain-containing protein [Thermodesulfobacteriota bacterium]